MSTSTNDFLKKFQKYLERVPYWFGEIKPSRQRPTGAVKFQTNSQNVLKHSGEINSHGEEKR